MSDFAMRLTAVLCMGLAVAVGCKGHARRLLWSGGTLWCVSAISGHFELWSPIDPARSILLMVGAGLAVGGAFDLLLRKVAKRLRT
jgi:hypothetical protein